MTDATLIAKIAREIERQTRNPRYIGRRSLDKTCGEVVEGREQRVVARRKCERAAHSEAEKRNRRHLAYTILQIARGNR